MHQMRATLILAILASFIAVSIAWQGYNVINTCKRLGENDRNTLNQRKTAFTLNNKRSSEVNDEDIFFEEDGNDDIIIASNPKDNINQIQEKSYFSRVLDDFVGRKFGAGEAFYGKRSAPDDNDKKSNSKSDLNNKQAVNLINQIDIDFELIENNNVNDISKLRPNAILIIGDPKYNVVQWLVYELLEKGFNIRLLWNNAKDCEAIFGNSGDEIDYMVFDTTITTKNNKVGSKIPNKKFALALSSIQAMVCVNNFLPIKTNQPFYDYSTEFFLTKKILYTAKYLKQQTGNTFDVAKIVYLSRYLPNNILNSDATDSVSTNKGNNLLDSIMNVELSIDNTKIPSYRSDINVADKKYQHFREQHLQLERYVKSLGFDYLVIRAPPIITRRIDTEKIFEEQLVLLSEKQLQRNMETNSASSQVVSLNIQSKIDCATLAETISRALLIEEAEQLTFHVGTYDNSSPNIDRPSDASDENNYEEDLDDDEFDLEMDLTIDDKGSKNKAADVSPSASYSFDSSKYREVIIQRRPSRPAFIEMLRDKFLAGQLADEDASRRRRRLKNLQELLQRPMLFEEQPARIARRLKEDATHERAWRAALRRLSKDF